MASFLKKLQLLTKKDSDESNPAANHGQGRRDNPELCISGFQPSTSYNPATQWTSQLLPLLVKSPSAPTEIKKKVQTQTVLLPDLVQRETTKSPPAAARIDDKQGAKVPAALPRLYEWERAQKGIRPQGKKRTPEIIMPTYPELSDERFRALWDKKKPSRGRPLKEMLATMGEREILDTILDQLRLSFQQASTDSKQPQKKVNTLLSEVPPVIQKPLGLRRISQPLSLEKILLYKYYGVKLRNSRHKDIVNEYLEMLLSLSVEEETDREGISEAMGVVAFCHLSEILMALRDFGHVMQAKNTSLLDAMPEEARSLSDRQTRTALMLCYGQAAMGAQPEDMLSLIEHIVSEILFLFSTKNKDEAMKKAFMRAVIMVSKALLRSKRLDINLPYKAELVICIILLYHQEIGFFFVKQDILDVLPEWMIHPIPLMQLLSVRGLGYLLQQPLENESLEHVLIPLINCASNPDKGIAKESIRALQYMFRHLDVEMYGFKATSLIPHLLKYFTDEDCDLRYSSINLFGTLLKGVREIHKSVVMDEILQSLVPLFIQLADGLTREVSKDTLKSCASYMSWVDMPRTLFDFGVHGSLNSMYLDIWRFIMRRYKDKFPDMLVQVLDYLTSRNPCYREAAAILLAM